jgi:LSD1 subclass zinc finger protein
MNTNVFDLRIRTTECGQCGAPIESQRHAREIRCRYCQTVNVIAERTAEPRRQRSNSVADEIARTSQLKAQLEHPVAGHAYDLQSPPLGWNKNTNKNEQLRKLWLETKSSIVSNQDPDVCHQLLWLGFQLADSYRQSNEPQKARAVLETCLELVSDPGHHHLIRCRLASEAVVAGELEAAEAWLEECDPAPEVLELDSAYREAAALVKTAQQDYKAVLALVGKNRDSVPIQPEHGALLDQLRIHALESLGHEEQAITELQATMNLYGEQKTLTAMVKNHLAPKSVFHKKYRQLQELANRKRYQPTLLYLYCHSLTTLPLLALILLGVVTIPRCFLSADPLLGAHGYVLCPHVCNDCTGPFRTFTNWTDHGNEYSTNGPQYFCDTPKYKVNSMSKREMERQLYLFKRNELSWSPGAATYLILLIFVLPTVPVVATRRYRRKAVERVNLDAEIQALAAELGQPIPELPKPSLSSTLSSPVIALTAAVLIPLLIIVLELAFHLGRVATFPKKNVVKSCSISAIQRDIHAFPATPNPATAIPPHRNRWISPRKRDSNTPPPRAAIVARIPTNI